MGQPNYGVFLASWGDQPKELFTDRSRQCNRINSEHKNDPFPAPSLGLEPLLLANRCTR